MTAIGAREARVHLPANEVRINRLRLISERLGSVFRHASFWTAAYVAAMYAFPVLNKIYGLALPVVGLADGGMTLLALALGMRALMYVAETRAPVIVGVTKLRRGRITRLARQMATVLSKNAFDRKFNHSGGNAAAVHRKGHSYMGMPLFSASATWAHELGHVIDSEIRSDQYNLMQYAGHPGARELQNHYENQMRSEPALEADQVYWGEVFAEAITAYIRNPHRFKILYPKGAALMRHVVNNSRAAKHIQLV